MCVRECVCVREREKLRTAFGALLCLTSLYWRKSTYVCGVCMEWLKWGWKCGEVGAGLGEERVESRKPRISVPSLK